MVAIANTKILYLLKFEFFQFEYTFVFQGAKFYTTWKNEVPRIGDRGDGRPNGPKTGEVHEADEENLAEALL